MGIVAALTGCLADHDGFITELAQFGTPTSERFYSRIEFKIPHKNFSAFQSSIKDVSGALSLDVRIYPRTQKVKTIIMVSKFDHCLADLIYRTASGSLNIEITAIISNHDKAAPRAKAAGIPFHHIPVSKTNKPDAEAKLRKIIAETQTELVILARYMQILSESFCEDFSAQIINIHHSFLPSFKGAKPYHRAYDLGVKLIGATAHYVTADLDEGPIIEQQVQRVDHTKTPDKLIAIGRDVEAQTLATAVKLHSERRSFLNGRKTVILP